MVTIESLTIFLSKIEAVISFSDITMAIFEIIIYLLLNIEVFTYFEDWNNLINTLMTVAIVIFY